MAQDLGPDGLKDPFSLFSYLVPTGGRVLITGDEPRGALTRLGYALEETKKDLRLSSLEPELLDAIWWETANAKYSIEDAFRILQTLFRGLRPHQGVLVLSFTHEKQARTLEHNPWNTRTVMTVLRQSGFQLFHTFESSDAHLYFCQRI